MFIYFILSLYKFVRTYKTILQIVPKGTHTWKDFLKPKYVKKTFLENGFNDFQVQGVNYNPFKDRWSYSEKTFINYMFFANKSLKL